MTLITKAVILSPLYIGAPSAAGLGYWNSQESFSKFTEDKCLQKDAENEDWKLAQEKLVKHAEENISLKFKELKDKLEKITTTDTKKENGEYLKDLCTEAYSWTYKSWFFKKESIFKDLKAFCSLKIEDKLEKSKLFLDKNDGDQAEIQKKITEMQQHNEANDGTLDQKLSEIKTNNKPSEDWKKLQEWCVSKYSEAYLGTRSSNHLKLAKKYCQKQQ